MKQRILILLCFLQICVFGQEQDTSEYKQLKVLYSEAFVNERIGDEEFQFYRGNIKILHDSTFMFCDSATTVANKLDAVGNIILLRHDTIEIFGDSLNYDGIEKYAKLYGEVILKNGDQKLYSDALFYDLKTENVSYIDTALLETQGARLSSLRGNYNMKSGLSYFYEEVIVIDSSFTLLCDTLVYDSKSKRANFVGPSYITQDENKIYCEAGYYDLETGNAYFEKEAKFYGDSLNTKSDYIDFNKDKNLITLTGNAIVEDGKSDAKAEKISFFRNEDIVILEGNGQFTDNETKASGQYIKYQSTDEKIWIEGSGKLEKDGLFLEGEKIFYDAKTNEGYSEGDVISEDKENGRKIYSDFLSQTNEEDFVAYNNQGRPYIEEIMDNDTLFLSADTLQSIQQIDSLDTFRIFRAYHDVRLFSNAFQGRADSLLYNTKDSSFIFFGEPILWADTTQFVADTILLKSNEEGIEQVKLRSNAFITNKLGIKYFDQIKGKNIFAKLDSSSIKWMEVKGNAQTIYLLRDENGAFIGANKTECSYIEFTFENKELEGIKFHSQPTSKMVPVLKASEAQLYLNGFDWNEKERPLSLNSILEIVKTEENNTIEEDDFGKDVLDILEKMDKE